MPLPDSVARLIENFVANHSEYHKGHYNETQTRIDYVNPLFSALGWDINNQKGLSELHREVIHEDIVKIGGRSKAPDYSFRAGGERKFFVETKQPSTNLYLKESPAFQLRRYAWTVKLPLSILTNFEEFVIYDTRVQPDKKDAAKTARREHIKFTDYAEKWDEIAGRFSRDAVLSGAFDEYAQKVENKSTRIPVDTAFLTEISGWRVKLANNIIGNNPGLSPRELNYAVQMTIDRIIFLRISEDRGVEPDFLLQPLMNKGGPIYPRLLDVFHRADARYNSGLFHFKTEPGREGPDDLTPYLTIDDRPLREIIASIYYPESPFEFSVFPADILGQVYEQFLGKVIRVQGKTAVVEYKPEVKKAGGVYYTPTYIVDYIVGNTVGKLVENKTPAQVAKLTVLDPACGSGSFLIGAYQFLLNWHLKYYTENDRAKWAKGKNATVYQKATTGGELWRLTTAEKKRILRSNIYGVDIDTQAVEVTKLSLLLKVLEGESAELIDNTLKLLQERALPDLENNIKCGNSLIGPDFYGGKDATDFDLDARLRINAFDWKTSFPDVMKSGGFDAVIGNPPYVSFGLRDVGTLGTDEAEYYRRRYENSAEYKISLYAMFIQAAVDLLRSGGMTSYIVPDSFLLGRYFSKLRRHILDTCSIEEILMIHARVFVGATIGISVVYNLEKRSPGAKRLGSVKVGFTKDIQQISDGLFMRHSYSQSVFEEVEYNRFRMFFDDASLNFVKKLEAHGSAASNFVSIHTGVRSKIGQKNIIAHEPAGKTWKSGLISGSEINRYSLQYAGNYLNIDKNLLWSGGWNPSIINATKMLIRQTGDSLTATLDTEKFYHLNNIHSAVLIEPHYDLRYVLALLNSRCMNHFYHLVSLELGRTMAQTDIETIEKLPIRPINFDDLTDKAKHDNMVNLVEQMLKLHKDKAEARLGQEKAMLQQEIEATDTQIDRLVYDLYGLTEEEIKIVEAAG